MGVNYYSLIEEIESNKSKVDIICPYHGIFTQVVSNHMNSKQGCPKCVGRGFSVEEVINRFIEEHGDKYNYSLVSEIDHSIKMSIICPEHGIFKQSPSKHLYQGCPQCKSISKGEDKLCEILEEYNIKYMREKSFKGCKHVNHLPFDFYLPDFNIVIEYDGIQHFKPFEFFGGEEYFNEIVKKDKIKDKYCVDNDIYIIRIPYTEYGNIDSIIKEKIINALSD